MAARRRRQSLWPPIHRETPGEPRHFPQTFAPLCSAPNSFPANDWSRVLRKWRAIFSMGCALTRGPLQAPCGTVRRSRPGGAAWDWAQSLDDLDIIHPSWATGRNDDRRLVPLPFFPRSRACVPRHLPLCVPRDRTSRCARAAQAVRPACIPCARRTRRAASSGRGWRRWRK